MTNMLEELREYSSPTEIWLHFKTCGKYYYNVSNEGRFASATPINRKRYKGRGWKIKIITPYPNKKGYMLVRTREDGQTRNYQLHRVVLSVFKPINDANKMQVNHIDGNKTNNRLENLEWCTGKENIRHAIRLGLIDHTRIVYMYSLNGNFIKEFPSITQAEKETGILITNICYCCSGKIRQAGNYQWRYKKYDNIGKVRSKKIADDIKMRGCKAIQMMKDGVVIKEFNSVLEAADYLKIKNGSANISACALGKRKQAYGYNWKYAIDATNLNIY